MHMQSITYLLMNYKNWEIYAHKKNINIYADKLDGYIEISNNDDFNPYRYQAIRVDSVSLADYNIPGLVDSYLMYEIFNILKNSGITRFYYDKEDSDSDNEYSIIEF